MTDDTEYEWKIQANRARRAAARQGFALQISRVRDPRAIGYRMVMVIRAETGESATNGIWLTLDDVERFLSGQAV